MSRGPVVTMSEGSDWGLDSGSAGSVERRVPAVSPSDLATGEAAIGLAWSIGIRTTHGWSSSVAS